MSMEASPGPHDSKPQLSGPGRPNREFRVRKSVKKALTKTYLKISIFIGDIVCEPLIRCTQTTQIFLAPLLTIGNRLRHKPWM